MFMFFNSLALLLLQVDNSTDQLKEKDEEIEALESRLASLSKTSTNNETIDQLQTSLADKSKQLERFV